MKKQEYLNQMKREFLRYPKEFREEMLEAYASHFEEGNAAGKTDEEIISELGTVKEVISNIREMYDSSKEEHVSSFDEFIQSIKGNLQSLTKFVKVDTQNTSCGKSFRVSIGEREDRIIESSASSLEILADTSVLNGSVEVTFGSSLSYESDLPVEIENMEDVLRLHMNQRNTNLCVWIPENIDSLSIKVMGADISIDSVELAEIVVKALAGDIEIENVIYDHAVIETNAGDISIYNCTGDMEASSKAGDIEVIDCDGQNIRVETFAGDIDVQSSFPVMNASTKAGDIHIQHTDEIENIVIDSNSGDIDCSFESDNYVAAIRSTGFGDIDVDVEDVVIKRITERECMVGNGDGKISICSGNGDIYFS